MSITNLSSIGMNPYDYACSRKKAAGTKNFAQKALGASGKQNCFICMGGGYGNLATAELFWFYL